MVKLYIDISTFMDSRQKTSGMTPKVPVIPAIFWRPVVRLPDGESNFSSKYHILNSHI